MKTLFRHSSNSNKNGAPPSTYKIGLLQTKAYKVLMGTTSELLKKSKISNSDWVALGTISDQPHGLRSIELAEIMAVEQPFITVLTNKLVKRGLLVISVDPTDKRAKIIHISKDGREFVKQTEAMLTREMEKISAGITSKEAEIYLKVIQSLVDYSENGQ